MLNKKKYFIICRERLHHSPAHENSRWVFPYFAKVSGFWMVLNARVQIDKSKKNPNPASFIDTPSKSNVRFKKKMDFIKRFLDNNWHNCNFKNCIKIERSGWFDITYTFKNKCEIKIQKCFLFSSNKSRTNREIRNFKTAFINSRMQQKTSSRIYRHILENSQSSIPTPRVNLECSFIFRRLFISFSRKIPTEICLVFAA